MSNAHSKAGTVEAVEQAEMEEWQNAIYQASFQLMNLEPIINSFMQKEGLAMALKKDLLDTKEQITLKMYKSVT